MNIVKSIFMIGILLIVASYLYSNRWEVKDQGKLTRINKYSGVVQMYTHDAYGSPYYWKTL